MLGKLDSVIQKHPVRSVIVAAVLGLILVGAVTVPLLGGSDKYVQVRDINP